MKLKKKQFHAKLRQQRIISYQNQIRQTLQYEQQLKSMLMNSTQLWNLTKFNHLYFYIDVVGVTNCEDLITNSLLAQILYENTINNNSTTKIYNNTKIQQICIQIICTLTQSVQIVKYLFNDHFYVDFLILLVQSLHFYWHQQEIFWIVLVALGNLLQFSHLQQTLIENLQHSNIQFILNTLLKTYQDNQQQQCPQYMTVNQEQNQILLWLASLYIETIKNNNYSIQNKKLQNTLLLCIKKWMIQNNNENNETIFRLLQNITIKAYMATKIIDRLLLTNHQSCLSLILMITHKFNVAFSSLSQSSIHQLLQQLHLNPSKIISIINNLLVADQQKIQQNVQLFHHCLILLGLLNQTYQLLEYGQQKYQNLQLLLNTYIFQQQL